MTQAPHERQITGSLRRLDGLLGAQETQRPRGVVGRGGGFDAAVARAVGNLEQVVPIALQYLKPGGVFIVSAAPPARLASLGAASNGEWRILDYPDLGLKRGFFVAQRPP